MSEHPNARTVRRMTEAVFGDDVPTLSKIFTDDMTFHLRGPYERAGDHEGLDGFLGVIGSLVETTGGQIELEERFCIADDEWAAEWEHATLGRNGQALESDNAFVYRFEDGRIAEMWMYLGASPDAAAAFFG